MNEFQHEFLKLKNNGLSKVEIAKILGCNPRLLYNIENNISDGYINNLKFLLKHNAFEQQTPESDFWAGVLASDGNITDKNVIRLGFKSQDIDFLLDWQNWINSKHKIVNNTCYKNDKIYYNNSISFKSDKIAFDLKQYYNISQRKSLILQSPIRKSLYFVAGYWMGDGCIFLSKKSKNWVLNLVGTKDILEWIRTYFDNLSNAKVLKQRNHFTLSYHGTDLVSKISTIIFDHSPFSIKRKLDKYHECLDAS